MKKLSQYNVFISKSNSVIVFNTLWNSYIITNSHYAELLHEGRCDDLKTENETLFNAIVEKKMFIDESVNEIEIIRDTLHKTNNPPDFFELIINPTLGCNFKCWYCYESHQDVSVIDNLGIQGIISFINGILSTRKIKKFILKFFGGEPLLAYNNVIKPILSKVHELVQNYRVDFSVGITTNGYLLSTERLNFLSDHLVQNLQITIDGNRERHNSVRFTTPGHGSYDRIVQNIHNSLAIGIFVSLRLNISKETKLNVRELLKDFDELDNSQRALLAFSIHKVWQDESSVYDIIDEIVSEIRASGYKCADYFSSPTSIWSTCYADKPNHLIINPNGRVYKCTACDFSDEHIEGKLSTDGLITWNSLHEKRLQISALDNTACVKCPILPICVGGCSQFLIESQNNLDCPKGMTLEEIHKYAYRVLSEKLERI